MIGVIAGKAEENVVREFFELFKTPWEFHQPGRRYQTVLCCGEGNFNGISANVLLIYADNRIVFDAEVKVQIQSRQKQPVFSYSESPLPIYGFGSTFQDNGFIARVRRIEGQVAVRVGYDLFREVGILLTMGQPTANSRMPALDLHITILRDLITSCGIPLVEIPPVPDGYSFITCLTHDVDHASLRRHRFDHTMFGFTYRATVGSAMNVARGRMSAAKLLTNWGAVAKLPLVYVGLAKDPWDAFDRYTEIENGKPSTFFFIPFDRHAGRSPEGETREIRASQYDISHVTHKIPKLRAAGCEIGLHGLDAWVSGARGRAEADRITEFSGESVMGVRMHWLYWNDESPVVLEDAGFSYDSTAGYNNAVGYKAGTNQIFKPLRANRLLELPLNVMDTALFYPDYMNLSYAEAWKVITPLLDHAESHGGTFTVNWHDRSMAPERLWGDFYVALLNRLESRRPWFSTAMQAVSWFRKRRAAVFETVDSQDGRLNVRVTSPQSDSLPDLRLRVHGPRNSQGPAENYRDTGFSGRTEIQISDYEKVTQ